MFIISGQGHYGKIDVVPNLCYVTTRFFHLYYVPLVPLGSFVVLEGTESGDNFQGVPTPMSFRSVLTGWVRAVLVLCVIGGLLWALDAWLTPRKGREGPEVPLTLAVVSGFAYWLTRRGSRATHARAHALGEQLGVSEEVVERCLMGLPPTPEAEETPEEPVLP